MTPGERADAADRLRAAELSRLGRHREALVVLDRILARNPQDARALGDRALAYSNLEEGEHALAAARAAVAADPELQFAHWILGVVYLRADRHQEGAATAREAVRLDPDDAWSQILLARCLQPLDPEAALVAACGACEVQPDNAHAWSARGELLLVLGRTEEARAAYEHCLAIDPNWAIGHANLARMARTTDRDWRAALSGHRRALAIDPQLNEPRMATESIIRQRIAFTTEYALFAVLAADIALVLTHGTVLRALGSAAIGCWAGLAWTAYSGVLGSTGTYGRRLLRDRSALVHHAVALVSVVYIVLAALVQIFPHHPGFLRWTIVPAVVAASWVNPFARRPGTRWRAAQARVPGQRRPGAGPRRAADAPPAEPAAQR